MDELSRRSWATLADVHGPQGSCLLRSLNVSLVPKQLKETCSLTPARLCWCFAINWSVLGSVSCMTRLSGSFCHTYWDVLLSGSDGDLWPVWLTLFCCHFNFRSFTSCVAMVDEFLLLLKQMNQPYPNLSSANASGIYATQAKIFLLMISAVLNGSKLSPANSKCNIYCQTLDACIDNAKSARLFIHKIRRRIMRNAESNSFHDSLTICT